MADDPQQQRRNIAKWLSTMPTNTPTPFLNFAILVEKKVHQQNFLWWINNKKCETITEAADLFEELREKNRE